MPNLTDDSIRAEIEEIVRYMRATDVEEDSIHGAAPRQDAQRSRLESNDRLGFLGVEIDRERNRSAVPDADVGTARAAVRCVVINSREDLEIAREVRTLMGKIGR